MEDTRQSGAVAVEGAGPCRVCAQRVSSNAAVSVFALDGEMHVWRKITAVAAVTIEPSDGLPSTVCRSCLLRANESHKFKLDCENSDRKLRKLIQEQTTKENTQSEMPKKLSCVNKISSNVHCMRSEESKNINVCDQTKSDSVYLKVEGRKIKHVNKDKLCPKGKKPYNINSIQEKLSNEEIVIIELPKEIENVIDKGIEFTEKNNKPKPKIKPQKQQCVTCGKVMSSRFCLKLHMRTHTGEKPFKCDYCEKKFSQAQGLKIHQRIHTGERPMKCKICDRCFTQTATLAAHVRLHTGETPYGCSLCHMKFRTRGHLHYHIRQHKGDKDFECDICGRAFMTRGDLKQHLRTHSGEKPYICSVCGQRLTRSSNLSRHMHIHNGLRPFKCTVCDVAYAQKVHLRRHMKKHGT